MALDLLWPHEGWEEVSIERLARMHGGEHKEEAIVYFAGQNDIVGLIKNPLWSGKRPIISAPVEEVTGSFWGKSKIEPVKFLQWQLTDFWNMGQDSAMYSMLRVSF